MKINLIPEVKQEQQKIHKMNAMVTTIATFVGFTLGAIVLTLALYNIYKTAQLASINKNIDKTNQKLEVYKDLEQTVISLETGLNEIKQIINGGARLSRFFSELEKATPAEVQFTNFKVEGNAISAELACNDVKSIDRLVKSLSDYKVDDKNLFENVIVDGYSVVTGKINFNAEFTMVGGILW